MAKDGKNNLAKVIHYYGLADVNTNDVKIICPLHEDINPSMLVDFQKNNWFCFGCNKSGDASRFVIEVEKKYHNLNELQGMLKYQKIINSNEVSHLDKIKYKPKTRKENAQSLDESSDYYFGLPTVNWCEDEQIFDDVFEIRKYMLDRGFSKKALNICKAKPTFNKHYPIIFPLLDNGTFKGWVCRTTMKSIEARRKYLYNEGFSRANTICGTYEEGKPIYIVEGYMDMLKLKTFGIKNVGAILGWKISHEQIQKLKDKNITKVISLLDNDECGRKGTKVLKQHFDVIRFSYLNGLKDPGDISSKVQFEKMKRRTKEKMKRRHNK